jgi:crotonobetainyl-CoA:carnitine CoA-transferase CaiB-like acyl-CoA transferase
MLGALGIASSDPRFETAQDRVANALALDEFVGTLARSHTSQELTTRLQTVGVAAYPIENCVDLHNDENLEAFGFWHWLDHKEMGPAPYEGLQHRMSRTPGDLRSAAPTLGQHNDEIFRDMLDLGDEEIEQLRQEKVIF